MAAPTTTAELLELVLKSGLVPPELLETYRQPIPESTGPGSQDLADRLVEDGLLTTYQARHLLKGQWRGFFIGKFKILRSLGKGGMGQVLLAHQQNLDRLVALKVLSPEHAGKPVAVARFHREARALASLDHPNIVRIFDVEEQNSWLYLVLEYVDGVSLQQLVREKGRLNLPEAIDVILQGACGLQHAHEAGWIHRDVKPSNLLLNKQGVVKVLDLGLALLEDEDGECLTRAREAILGSLDYLSPEQSIDSHDVDGRTDVYSLGATLYFLLTGKPPFTGSPMRKISAHRRTTPRPIRQIRPDVPPEVEAILDRMMAKNREYRYQTPAEMILALRPWVGTTGVHYPEIPETAPQAMEGTGELPALITREIQALPAVTLAPPVALSRRSLVVWFILSFVVLLCLTVLGYLLFC